MYIVPYRMEGFSEVKKHAYTLAYSHHESIKVNVRNVRTWSAV